MAARPREPLRTCVGCRRVRSKSELVRIVVRGDAIVADPEGHAPGRGAYVCPDPACIARAEGKAAQRALRAPGVRWHVEMSE